jgi:hypothetical protein
MLAIASTTSTDRATGPLFWSISTSALDPIVGAGGGASDWRNKARVAARIGVYLNLKVSRWGSGIQVGNVVHRPLRAPVSLLCRGMLRSESCYFASCGAVAIALGEWLFNSGE